jgi:hypothetical protein
MSMLGSPTGKRGLKISVLRTSYTVLTRLRAIHHVVIYLLGDEDIGRVNVLHIQA